MNGSSFPKMPSIYIGFDGGATKTKGVALDVEKRIISEAVGNSANFQIIGVEQTCKNLFDLARTLLEKIETDFSSVKSICLGLAGAGRKEDADKMRRGFIDFLKKNGCTVPVVMVVSDAVATLEGAFDGKPGMILISGTGSILCAKGIDGTVHRIGGWGRFIGDEGSGYAIGQACLAAIARELDGRGKRTMMTEIFKERFTTRTLDSLIVNVYQRDFDIASVAPVAIKAAEKGDEIAVEIITRNVDQLVEHVSAMLNKLGYPLPLVVEGSLLSTDNFYSRKFKDELKDKFPQIEIGNPEFPPAVGAALLAFKKAEM
jgi:glucosamine kinase